MNVSLRSTPFLGLGRSCHLWGKLISGSESTYLHARFHSKNQLKLRVSDSGLPFFLRTRLSDFFATAQGKLDSGCSALSFLPGELWL